MYKSFIHFPEHHFTETYQSLHQSDAPLLEKVMDLIPAQDKSQILKKHRFRSLKRLNVDLDDVLPEKPFGADYGRLENGLYYYVRSNSKPKMRASLALVVKVGSVLEEEHERGVAHIVEHLAFSATTKYPNHELVKFMESIGAEFGPCQNASTSTDETIYELFVPIDKPELLSQAISILAEFSTEVRVSKDDLEKERGAVIEEYRLRKNAYGRIQEAHWGLLMKGSKYAERLPIGLEKIIKTVTHDDVKKFYKKWYHLHNMAVVAVGDFPDTQNVVELIKTHFGQKHSEPEPPLMPQFQVPSHEEPRFSCFVESEAGGSSVTISYKMPVEEFKTVKDYRDFLTEEIFIKALNRRFFKLSRRKDPPYFSCSASTSTLVSPVKAFIISASCKEEGSIEALESMLLEVARVRLHGFSEHEISVARAVMLSEIESEYLERDKMHSTNLRAGFVQHFLRNQPVTGIEYEAKLQKSLLPYISASDLFKYAENIQTSFSCVVKIIEPQASATVAHLKAVVTKINSINEAKCISSWDNEQIPEEIVSKKPNQGDIVKQREFSNIEANELILSNGMRICYKCTDFQDDQVIFKGFSYGGLSEVPESDYLSCSMSLSIAEEVGAYGYRPSVMSDMLAGKRADVSSSLGPYKRAFSGYCSPSDLETALQLVYQLFTTEVTPEEDDVKIVMQLVEDSIHAKERDPNTAFINRVIEINYGNSYYFRPTKISDLQKVDPSKGCLYFNSCFKDPSTFTVVMVGNIDPIIAQPLILQYLGGIPRPCEPILHLDRDELKGLQFTFPTSIIREIVPCPMVEAQCSVQITFPVELKNESLNEESYYVGFLMRLLETKLLQVLRFKHGQIYSASVDAYFNGEKPSRTNNVRGDISISFSCDPDFSSKLADLALNEVLRLQEVGPSNEDVSSILEIEQRAFENGLQENYEWLDKLLGSYQSRIYSGDVGNSFQIQDDARSRVVNSLTPLTTQHALQRILPYPCKKLYTVVIMMPTKVSRFKLWINSFFKSRVDDHGRESKILVGVAGAAILAFTLWKYTKQ